jgi:hypothetical protein
MLLYLPTLPSRKVVHYANIFEQRYMHVWISLVELLPITLSQVDRRFNIILAPRLVQSSIGCGYWNKVHPR